MIFWFSLRMLWFFRTINSGKGIKYSKKRTASAKGVEKDKRNSRLAPFCILTMRTNLCGSPNGSSMYIRVRLASTLGPRGGQPSGTSLMRARPPRFTPSCSTWSSVLFSLNPRRKDSQRGRLTWHQFASPNFALPSTANFFPAILLLPNMIKIFVFLPNSN